MKTRFVFAGVAALCAAALTLAQTERKPPMVHIDLDAPPPASKKSPNADPNAAAKPAAPSTGKADPNKPAAPADAKKDAKKKEDDAGKIDGMEIARGAGFMGLQIVEGAFKLTFYDGKKKPVAPDVARAVFRWNVPYQKAPERALLTSNGTAMVADKTVKPPFNFKLFVTLFKGEGDENAENLTIDFTQ